jgi:hypothetical protein
MKKRMGFSLVAMILAAVSVNAADWYVSSATGKNKGETAGKSAETPFKNIQKAIDAAVDGDTIKVAAGNYFGLMNKGFISVTKNVTIEGGYSADFKARDPLANQTLLQPPNSSNGTGRNNALLELSLRGKTGKTVIDGLILDRGMSSSYHAVKGKPAGVDTGLWMEPPAKNGNDAPSIKKPLLGQDANVPGGITGDVVIRNCAFVNGYFGIQLPVKTGTVTVENCIFVANLMAACEVRGASAKKESKLVFANNTVLFTWSRTMEMNDMGYGVRIMTGTDYDIHDNIIGLSCLGGIDHTRKGQKPESGVTLNKNLFFMNKEADLVLPGTAKFLRIRVDMFDDEESIQGEGNAELKDAAALKSVLNLPYLDGFLAASYKESKEYDENSAANTFRAAMGMNKQGKISSDVSMFGNRYPLADALKLFGAVKGCGAQAVK